MDGDKLSDRHKRAAMLEVSIVVPVFNEENCVSSFVEEISEVFKADPLVNLEIVFVNDGSTDDTLQTILECQKDDARLRVVDLSRNFGKEAAVSAGLHVAAGQVIVVIDVDLQDPPGVILEMIAKWREGYEVVAGHRVNRDSDSWSKRASANWFYRIHNKIGDTRLPENVGDFRLMDRVVVEALKALPESCRFMKGLFAWVGFRCAYVDYVRPCRLAGTTKFNGWSLWNFALEGMTSFSTAPLRIWSYLGLVVSLAGFVFATFIVVKFFIYGVEVPGYASIIVALTLLGGLQLIGIGVLGEYLGRTYMESKRRPLFIVRRIYEQSHNEPQRDGHPWRGYGVPLASPVKSEGNDTPA
jgi:glycosyltransferase involved in cell wall biosynthesis